MIENDDWSTIANRASPRQYKYRIKQGLVTIADKSNHDIVLGELNSILKQVMLVEYSKA